MSRWWYLSFAGHRGWQGGVVLRADTQSDAIKSAKRLGVHPGGEVKSTELISVIDPPPQLVGRLIRDKGELNRITAQWIADDNKARDEN